MGLFGDKLRDAVESAQAITPEVVTVEPSSRLESLVVDPRSGENRHRTDYAGTIWFGGRPEVHGRHSLPGASSEIAAPVALPDSLAYRSEAAGEVHLQAAATIQGGQVTSAGEPSRSSAPRRRWTITPTAAVTSASPLS